MQATVESSRKKSTDQMNGKMQGSSSKGKDRGAERKINKDTVRLTVTGE